MGLANVVELTLRRANVLRWCKNFSLTKRQILPVNYMTFENLNRLICFVSKIEAPLDFLGIHFEIQILLYFIKNYFIN